MNDNFNPKDYLISLKGRDYLEVKWRVVWFRADHPNGGIDTEIISTSPLIIKASVYDADGKRIATGHGTANNAGQNAVWKGKEIEKAETAAIGRALANAGYGTQFTDDFDEDEDHPADSPVQRQQSTAAAPKADGKKPAPVTNLDTDTRELMCGIVETKAYTDKKTGEERKRLVYHCADGVMATDFSTKRANAAGYDVSTWGVEGEHELMPPALVTVKAKGDFWDVVEIKQALTLAPTGTGGVDFLA